MGENKRLVYLDMVRVFACFCILTIHFNASVCGYDTTMNFTYQNELIPNFYRGMYLGEIGNSLFFIISGAALEVSNHFSELTILGYRHFVWKRLKALLPMYWIAYTAAICFHMIVYKNIPMGTVWNFIPTIFGMDGYAMVRGWFSPQFYMLGEWFLGCMLLCYLLWPVLAYLWGRSSKLITLIAAGAYILQINQPGSDKFVIIRLCQMLAGACFVKFCTKKHRWQWAVLSALTAIICLCWKSSFHIFTVTFAFCWALFVIIAVVTLECPAKFSPFGSLLAKASALTYPLFLVHHRIIFYLCMRYELSWFPYRYTIVLYIGYLALSLFAAKGLVRLQKSVEEATDSFRRALKESNES